MAQALMHDDEAAADLRRGLKYAERASGGSDTPTSAETAKTEAKAAADKKKEPASYKGSLTAGKEAIGGALSKIKDAATGANGGSVGERGYAAGEGAAEALGGLFAPIQQLIHNVIASGGGDAEMPKPIARVLNAAMRLPAGGKEVVSEVFAGSKEAAAAKRAAYDAETEKALDAPLSWAQGLSMIGATAVGGKLATKGHGAEAPKVEAAAKPNAARFEAASPVEPPNPAYPTGGNAKAMAKFAADRQARINWENAQKAAGQTPVAAPEGAVKVASEGVPTPAESLGHTPLPEGATPGHTELQASLAQPHGIISAEKTGLGNVVNSERMQALEADLKAKGYSPVPALGEYQGGKENSFFVTGADLAHLQELGKKYGQESVIHNGDLHYTTGEHAGKVRANLGTTFDVPEGTDGTRIGNARFSNAYDWEAEPTTPGAPVAEAAPGTIEPGPAEAAPVAEQPSSPLAAEAPATELPAEAKPVEGEQPPAEATPSPMEGTEGAGSQIMPEETQPVTPDPFVDTEGAGGAPPPPPINTVADLHTAVQPHAEAPIAEAIQKVVADEAAVRESATQLAQQMRAVGATRSQINEAYRAKLNEGGVFSKKQQAESAKLKAIDPAQASRGVAAAIMENPADPEPVIVNFLKKLGLPEEMAIDIADKTTEAMKKQLGEDGAGGIDLTKTENAPFDKVAANRALAEKVRKLCP